MSKATIDLKIPVGSTNTAFWLPQKDTDHVQRVMYQGRSFYEFGMLCHAQALLSEGDEVIDVGAYIGNHTLFYANVCGAKVFSFEPNRVSYDVMRANLELNGLSDSVTTVCAGVAAKAGRAKLIVPSEEGNAGMCQLEVRDEGSVEITCLDDQKEIRNPRLIKIDVEGMEVEVLRGAERLISKHHPVLYIESATAAHYVPISEILLGWGYRALAQFNATTTICFVHSSDSERILNEQISYFQYDLRQQLGHVNKRIASIPAPKPLISQQAANGLVRRFDQLSKDVSASLRVQDQLKTQVALLVSTQKTMSRTLEALAKTTQRLEQEQRHERRSKFGRRTARKIRKARKEPGRFITDSSSYRGLIKLLQDHSKTE